VATIGQQATDQSGKVLTVGDQVSVPILVITVTSSGPSATVTGATLGSGTSVSVQGGDLGASVYDAKSAAAPSQAVTAQGLSRSGLPVQAADQATVIGTISAIASVNGAYGSAAAVTVLTQNSNTSLALRGSDIHASMQNS
jgi:hypothetical protein